MSVTNPLANYAPFILNHLADVVDKNAPETKVTPTGFLKACLENDPQITMPESEKLRLNTEGGQIKQIRLSYLQRIKPSQTSGSDDCENDFMPFYNDTELTTPLFRKVSLFIEDATIARYTEEAARTVMVGQPATPFMNEHLRSVRTYVNGLLGAMNTDLLSQVTWGVNAVTGNNNAKTVNIEQDGTLFDLSTGFAQVLDDLDTNEFAGTPIFVGGGIFNKWMRSRSFQTSQLGGLTNSLYNDFKYYYDNYTQTSWGSNQVGVFSSGSFGFVDLNKFVGFRAGQKGTSYFFQITLPVMPDQNDGTAGMMKFDCQLKYIDCPTEIYNGYSTTTVNRGWQLIISKNFGLFQVPADAYQSGDVLDGNNGALRYAFTNS